MARAIQLIGLAAVASANTGPPPPQLRGRNLRAVSGNGTSGPGSICRGGAESCVYFTASQRGCVNHAAPVKVCSAWQLCCHSRASIECYNPYDQLCCGYTPDSPDGYPHTAMVLPRDATPPTADSGHWQCTEPAVWTPAPPTPQPTPQPPTLAPTPTPTAAPTPALPTQPPTPRPTTPCFISECGCPEDETFTSFPDKTVTWTCGPDNAQMRTESGSEWCGESEANCKHCTGVWCPL
ncbi:unnamed protein product [Prorocentrum cordatum]|uniref:Cellulase n=1 Tax=Prorocentrum cordatum TaxID=2364126 RepID=A0ABN9UDT1_9DINO|nr:unnamed protein product [Polarella glacialis]|mmetsp:Transcript_56520/g.146927  ORF Transcript_56520/g.146927 Transcript_56520/m.146927 type:complete len:237 (+) Transcript_56520:106-816(+)